ncbi:endonuclease/exonuclease/phosphatase family protein [Cooperia oncophora]
MAQPQKIVHFPQELMEFSEQIEVVTRGGTGRAALDSPGKALQEYSTALYATTFAKRRESARIQICSPTTPGDAATDEGRDLVLGVNGQPRLRRRRMNDYLDICTYNCRTLSMEASLRTLLHQSRKIRYDIICLQETKAKEAFTRKMDEGQLLVIGQKNLVRNSGGVGFLVNRSIESNVHSHEILSPRIALLRLKTRQKAMISIVNCYAPTNSADEEEKDAFYHELEEVVKREKSYYKYLCGDFNAALGNGNDGNWRLGKHVRKK